MLKKILFIVISFLFVTGTAYAATNLWEWYAGDLPSCEERAGLYNSYFSDKYLCTAEQNELLLAALQNIAVFGSGGVTVKPGTIGVPVINATAGSLLFAGANSVLSEDNAGLFYDDSNNFLGIGSTTPTTILSIGTSGASTTISTGKLQFQGEDSDGALRCVFLDPAGAFVSVAGACQ